MAQQERRYSVGLQTFSSIIQSGRVYVDKTDLVWQALLHHRYHQVLCWAKRHSRAPAAEHLLDAQQPDEHPMDPALAGIRFSTATLSIEDWKIEYPAEGQ